MGVRQGGAETTFEGQKGLGARPPLLGAPLGPFWASWLLSLDSKAQTSLFGEKLTWYFSSILYPAKTDRKKTLLKTASDSAVFIQVWEDSGANHRAKYLEKWIHLRCISSPKLSSLFVLKQLKRSVEAIKDFDKNFALFMHNSLT